MQSKSEVKSELQITHTNSWNLVICYFSLHEFITFYSTFYSVPAGFISRPPDTHSIHPPQAACSTTPCVHGIATCPGPLLVSTASDPGPLSLLIGCGHGLEPNLNPVFLIPPLETHRWLSPTRHIPISLLTSATCPPLMYALFSPNRPHSSHPAPLRLTSPSFTPSISSTPLAHDLYILTVFYLLSSPI